MLNMLTVLVTQRHLGKIDIKFIINRVYDAHLLPSIIIVNIHNFGKILGVFFLKEILGNLKNWKIRKNCHCCSSI